MCVANKHAGAVKWKGGWCVKTRLPCGNALTRDALLTAHLHTQHSSRSHTNAHVRVCVQCNLQTVNQSKQVQAATLEELQDQGDQLYRVNEKMGQVCCEGVCCEAAKEPRLSG